MLLDVEGAATCKIFIVSFLIPRTPLLISTSSPSIGPSAIFSSVGVSGELTASSAQSVRLVVALTEAGGTLRCRTKSVQDHLKPQHFLLSLKIILVFRFRHFCNSRRLPALVRRMRSIDILLLVCCVLQIIPLFAGNWSGSGNAELAESESRTIPSEKERHA